MIHSLESYRHGATPPAAERPKTALKQWQLRRDLVIVAAHRNGASIRLLADVFDLKPAQIHRIIHKLRDRYVSPQAA